MGHLVSHSPSEILFSTETLALITEAVLELVRLSTTPKAYVTHSIAELVTQQAAGTGETHFVIEMLANIPAPVPPSRISHSPAEVLFSTSPLVFESHVIIEVLNKIYVPIPEVRTTRVGPRLQSH